MDQEKGVLYFREITNHVLYNWEHAKYELNTKIKR